MFQVVGFQACLVAAELQLKKSFLCKLLSLSPSDEFLSLAVGSVYKKAAVMSLGRRVATCKLIRAFAYIAGETGSGGTMGQWHFYSLGKVDTISILI